MEGVIRENLSYLCQNTVNLHQLVVLLIEENILSENERQEIIGQPTDFRRNQQLYLSLQKRPITFPDIKRWLKSTGNIHISDKLESTYNSSLSFEHHSSAGFKPNNDETNPDKKQKTKVTPPIWFEIGQPSIIFRGRSKEMEVLQKLWIDNHLKGSLLFSAIIGLGGVGKTELTRHFAKWFYNKKFGHCIRINCETKSTTLGSLQRLAKVMKLPDQLDLQGLFLNINNVLLGSKCLYVLDNFDSYFELLQLFTSYAKELPPQGLKPLILITSRCLTVLQHCEFARKIDLGVLEEEAAVEFFIEKLVMDRNDDAQLQDIKLLSHRLQYLPLAMKQAAAFISASNWPHSLAITNYLKLFEQVPKKVLNFEVPDEVKTTYITWKVTLQKLESISFIGADLIKTMEIISVCNADQIRYGFLKDVFKNEFSSLSLSIEQNILERLADELYDRLISTTNNIIVTLLVNHSMISYDYDTEQISVHRLVQDVLKIDLKENPNLIDMQILLLGLINECTKNVDKILAEDIVHVRSIWSHAIKQGKEIVAIHSNFPNVLCNKHFSLKQYQQGFEFCTATIDKLLTVVNPNDTIITNLICWKACFHIKSKNSLGAIPKPASDNTDKTPFYKMGSVISVAKIVELYNKSVTQSDASIWLKQLNKAVKIDTPENMHLLHITQTLADRYMEQQNESEALKLHKEVRQLQKQILGVDDVETVVTQTLITDISIALRKKLSNTNPKEHISKYIKLAIIFGVLAILFAGYNY